MDDRELAWKREGIQSGGRGIINLMTSWATSAVKLSHPGPGSRHSLAEGCSGGSQFPGRCGLLCVRAGGLRSLRESLRERSQVLAIGSPLWALKWPGLRDAGGQSWPHPREGVESTGDTGV